MEPKRGLSDEAFCRQAKALRCGVANIKAVAEVESRGDGFLPSGKPKILFERHKFDKALAIRKGYAFRNEIRAKYPNICSPRAGGYGRAGEHQWRRFSLAYSLDPVSAMLACSWGRFQVMGFNWQDLGYDSVHDFVDQMKQSEDNHLDAFVRFVRVNGLADELRNRQWARFARRYNGPAYKKNKYDTKMGSAYRKYSRERINCDEIIALSEQEIDVVVDTLPAEPASPVVTPDPTPDVSDLPPSDEDLPNDGDPQDPTNQEAEADNDPKPEPVGQKAGEEPKAKFKVEDYKGFCQRWLKRVWGLFTGVTIPTVPAGFITAVQKPEIAPYALGGTGVVVGLLLILAIIATVGLGVVLWWNRAELRGFFGHWIANEVDPTKDNYDFEIVDK